MTDQEFNARIEAMAQTLELIHASQLHSSQIVEATSQIVEALAVSQQRAHDEMTEMRASISDLLRVATAHEDRLNDLDGKGFQ